ncbi:MAG: prolyl oligopeptidase family serine peptidase [Caulobacter sp.]|nr:prolyl oligopeptidase family serine peptidase [Caulobacter sp.]
MKLSALAAVALLASAAPALAQTESPFEWLEQVDSDRSMDWVRAENARTLPVLTGDARFAGLQADALSILSASDRIPTPTFVGKAVFNFWQDETHVRGVWRRTTLDSYRTATPRWETVLDLDALSTAEQANWNWKGANCRPVTYDRCLVRLSNGGKDAVEVREFDLTTKAFVDGGFRLPESKQTVAWLDADTLILTRDFGPGTTTESGYGMVVKTLKRGQSLDQAVEVFRGESKDVSAQPDVLRDGTGHRLVLIHRGLDFFNRSLFRLSDDGTVGAALPLPTRLETHGYLGGRLIASLQQDWTFADVRHPAGALLAVDLDRLEVGTADAVEEIYTPKDREALNTDEIAVTESRVVAVRYANVRGQLLTFRPTADGWETLVYGGLENAAVSLVSTADEGDGVFFTEEGFTTPTRLRFAQGKAAKAVTVKTLPARFDASNLKVEQHEATSKDGTKVPYFIIHPKGHKHDGQDPTLIYGYGGFQVSKPAVYDPLVGKLWLERGGTYVVANIRGGGEFGPAWHEAALKANRQRAYDDYFAVAEDLIARKITSPRRLGAYGRSNGGLLMGVAMTQRPDLWNAVIVESPLLDMLRYHLLPAGASWIGEYGDPTIPEEAAWIAAYSPFQNLKPGVKYPLAYVTTSTKDDRVHPGHARKFVAQLEAYGDPVLYFENTDGGHANGADPTANARRWGMHYTYLTRQLMD